MNGLLLPERCQTTLELHQRALDFTKRAIFKGYTSLTSARREKLWSDAEWFLADCFEDGITSWDQDKGRQGMYACDWFHERFDEKYFPNTPRWDKKFEAGQQPKYLDVLNFVVRSAIDLVDNWAGGCIGWTIGDFKRMYDGELPPWFPKDEWQIMGDGLVPFSTLKDESVLCV